MDPLHTYLAQAKASRKLASQLPSPGPSPPMGNRLDSHPYGLESHPAGSGGNHAMQDYQMQLILLEQQRKKMAIMSRQYQLQFSAAAGSVTAVAEKFSDSGFLPTPPRSTQNSPQQQGQQQIPLQMAELSLVHFQNRNQEFRGTAQQSPRRLSHPPSNDSQFPQGNLLSDPFGKNVIQLLELPSMGMLPLSPKPESLRPETVHNRQIGVCDIDNLLGSESMHHSSTHDEIVVHCDPGGAIARLPDELFPLCPIQSLTKVPHNIERDQLEAPSNPANDASTRNDSLSSFTEDDTDWGEDENSTVYDFQFADFSAISDRRSFSQNEIKVNLTRPVFSPMKQEMVDRIMKEFWSIWDGESGFFR
jgi:hypothetical protein